MYLILFFIIIIIVNLLLLLLLLLWLLLFIMLLLLLLFNYISVCTCILFYEYYTINNDSLVKNFKKWMVKTKFYVLEINE